MDALCDTETGSKRIDSLESAADADDFARQVNAAIDDGDLAAFEVGSVDEITARMDAFCERG